MKKSKKIFWILGFLAVLIVIVSTIVLINYKLTVYEEKSDDGKIEIIIQKSLVENIFQPGTMGGNDYSILVYRNDALFKKKLLSRDFYFVDDGAPLTENNVYTEWSDDSVKITIKGEGNSKIFTCDF